MKKITLWLLVLTVILSTFSAFMVAQADDSDYEIVMVVKLEGVAWFDNIRSSTDSCHSHYRWDRYRNRSLDGYHQNRDQ